ncbi:hypothetical protein [Pseudoalteromonas rhizosphaerae]|uniref:hypothetical protein n=1 Tax=Pseudoalteromonas rhizosphaerae TaxID=2518973 RepID=UPI00384C787C
MHAENSLSNSKNILINLTDQNSSDANLNYLLTHFCGTTTTCAADITCVNDAQRIYVIGDLAKLDSCFNEHVELLVIKEFSLNIEPISNATLTTISHGQVPLNIHNAGVYYRKLFSDESDYFSKIKTEHDFQQLTESNKPSTALRKGIYISKVTQTHANSDDEQLHFHLLRCSSNLTGATDNLRETDHHVVNVVNEAAKYDFTQPTDLNHVLAQIYENKAKDENNPKDVKAKIKAHSDKTKDMPKAGLIAFCTFYENSKFAELTPSKTDTFDWCYKKSSALTRLIFKLKPSVTDESLVKEFTVTLYPNSVFIIPLSTNRLYTHEIRPSVLNIDKIPIRMGYVIRCSNLEAVYTNDKTFIKENDELIEMKNINDENMLDLRDAYYKENKYQSHVDYGTVHFSMNSGDYKKPIL